MAARNDITGQEIKSKPQNSAYSEGWDKIYATKSSIDWLKSLPNVTILSPDGWNDGLSWDTPIKWRDFLARLSQSKIENY